MTRKFIEMALTMDKVSASNPSNPPEPLRPLHPERPEKIRPFSFWPVIPNAKLGSIRALSLGNVDSNRFLVQMTTGRRDL